MNVTKTITKTKTATYVIVATILAGTLFAVTAILISKIVMKPNPVAFGDVVVNTTKYKATMATNTSSNPLTIKKIVVSNPAFALKSTSTCKVGKVINPQKACSFIIKFNPTVVGSKSGTIKITDNKGRIATVKITGRGIAATVLTKKLTLSPASLTFDPTNINSSQIKEISVTNSGTALITLTGITVSGNSFSLDSSSTCSSGQNILEPTGTCKIAIKFSPTVTQNYTGSLTMNTDSTTNPSYQAAMTGSGTGITTLLTADPTSLSFTSINENQTITLRNSGTEPVYLNNTSSLNSPFFRKGGNCGQRTLAVNDTCTIDIRFLPSATGTFNSSIDVMYGGSNLLRIHLQGSYNGVLIPVAYLELPRYASGNTINFGNVAAGRGIFDGYVYVNSIGGANLVINQISVTGTYFTRGTRGCADGQALAPGGWCAVQMWFQPTSVGSFSGTLFISTNDQDFTLSLAGNGI